MQVYFVKATYTNNVYKLSDFFLNGDYKKDINKMLDINFIANDDKTIIRTRKIELPDASNIREHTHIIVPDYNKIYRIESIDYMNQGQVMLELTEDAMIGNYLDLEDTDLILERSNDPDLFRGINDISDVTLKETVSTKVINSDTKTGQWALIFMQVNTTKGRYGLRFKKSLNFTAYENYTNMTAITTAYPEVATDSPELFDYYQKVVFSIADLKLYQCIYVEGSTPGLYWIEWEELANVTDVYFNISDAYGGRVYNGDIRNVILALPLETVFDGNASGTKLLSFNDFVGPVDAGEILDVKIINDMVFPFTGVNYTINLTTRKVDKTLQASLFGISYVPLYDAVSGGVLNTDYELLALPRFEKEIDLNPGYFVSSPSPLDSEPFYKNELYIFGQRFSIPYYLTTGIKLLIAVNSGVINYTIYYLDKRNIIGSGSFTHSVKFQVDKLDEFYNQNPTYKDQFYLKMAGNSFKTVAGATAGGAVMGGPAQAAIAGSTAAVTSAVDAGLSIASLQMMEKGLALKPDQVFGDISELALQFINLFGIYWVRKTSENIDLMKTEYDLKGFPTEVKTTIDNISYTTSALFAATSKVIYGQIKKVIKNEYTTNFINEKLKEGIILIP